MAIYPFLWFLLGLIFIISELFIPGFTIFFFGCGAILTAIAGLFIPWISINYTLQLILWLTSSIGALFFLRKRFYHTFSGTIGKNQSNDFCGRTAKVTEEIGLGRPGRIRINGTTWNGEVERDQKIFPGDTVHIIRRKMSKSLTFIVEKTR